MITGKINAVQIIQATISFTKGLTLTIDSPKTLTGILNGNQNISGTINAAIPMTATIDPAALDEGATLDGTINLPKVIKAERYIGNYEVTPTSSEQSLLTKNKHMEDDVTIHKIPYYETSNLTGITVYIGGE